MSRWTNTVKAATDENDPLLAYRRSPTLRTGVRAMRTGQWELPDVEAAEGGKTIRFGPFVMEVPSGAVRFRGSALPLARDCLAVLRATAAAAGAPVHQDQLLLALDQHGAPCGPDQLWSCVTRLNTALCACSSEAGYIAHFPLEGFALVLPQSRGGPQGMQGLPARLSTVIGCEDITERIRARLLQHRFVSIVGAGGMGKTTVAGVVAAGVAPAFPDGVCFVDLAPLADARLLPNVLAQALGVATVPGAAMAGLAAFLREKRLLVVLDSCEHLVGAAADLAEQLLRAAPQLSLLATSREPLLASGEWLYRLGAMRLPPRTGGLSAAQALAYPAVQLFVERARERQPDFALDDTSAAHVRTVCHRLDGIPLAIELAAARVALLGVETLADQIQHRLLTAVNARRSAAARHHTLGAMLDWSYDLLPPREQQALVRLSVFRGEFTLAAAGALLSDGGPGGAAEGADSVLELLSKSLVSQRDEASLCRYRLLDTTRTYAGAKLDAGGERRQLQERHARYLCALMKTAEEDWLVMSRGQWLDTYKMWIDDIRVALDWTFADGGDVALGNELIIATFPLGHQASLTAEFGERVGHAMTLAPRTSITATLLYTQLYALLCNVNALVDPEDSGLAAAARAADGAEAGSPLVKYRTALATSMWAAAFLPGDFPTAIRRVDTLRGYADSSGDRQADMVARRMHAQSLHFIGRQVEAQAQAEQVLANAWRKIPLVCSPAQVDVRVSMRIILARIAWIGGRPMHARELTAEALQHASADTAVVLAQALSLSCIPIALWCGERDTARELVQRLTAHAGGYSLHMWMAWASFYRDVVADMDGDDSAAGRLIAPSAKPLENMQRDHLVSFRSRLLAEDSIVRVQSGLVGWCAAEVLRAQGERHARHGETAAAAALLMRALETARAQSALAWELRAAISLASLWQQQQRGAVGRALLEPLVARFTEGYDAADLRCARTLLESL